VLVTAKAASVHWCVGTDPTSSVGNYLPEDQVGVPLIQNDPDAVQQLRFIAIEAGSGKLICRFFEEP
jgi:hypothetical protein